MLIFANPISSIIFKFSKLLPMFFEKFKEEKNYSSEIEKCIVDTVNLLNINITEATKPGMLLGKIQSGKTRTFIGVIALCFDKGYDICVVLTKGTNALSEQTFIRFRGEFSFFVDNHDLQIWDIMKLPPHITPYLQRQKIIIVVKKQSKNLDRLINLFVNHPTLNDKKVLFVDDEADFGSVGFKKDNKTVSGISFNVLSTKIDSIRNGFKNNYSFLQVTATPYSLYLQREGEFELNGEIFQPVKPAFTSIVPIHHAYIGGKEYFEQSTDEDSIYSNLYIRVLSKEIEVLAKRDQRYINNILETRNLEVFRISILNYLVGGSIRTIQEGKLGAIQEGKYYKTSFIIHISTNKGEHLWQFELVQELIKRLKEQALDNLELFQKNLEASYENLKLSVLKSKNHLPPFNEVVSKVKEALVLGDIGVIKVNSETEVARLLDGSGQLRLDSPFNIFIGGQILDRGLTITNLIGFFYGRNPGVFQQDTVLQHSRMYGARNESDITVTRLYTSDRIYDALKKMHFFDSTLGEAFERGEHDNGVIFLETDSKGLIRPCAPNKILITSTEVIKPHGRYLPIGFQTKSKTSIQKTVSNIHERLTSFSNNSFEIPFLINFDEVKKILEEIESTFEYSDRLNNTEHKWDLKSYLAILNRIVSNKENENFENKIYCIVREGRDLSRLKNNDSSFSDAPDDGKTDTPLARSFASNKPCLILIKQNGKLEKGWRDAEFWWPVLVTPANTKTAIYAKETIS